MILPGEDCPELPIYTQVSAEELLLGASPTSRYDGLTPLYKRLPHGPHGLGREAVARHQRARLYGGMAESVYQRGYGATSVAHVIALAGVSRRAFYEQFSNKEDCFLATYDALVGASRKRVLQAWMGERGWANRLYAATQVFLEGIAGDPRGANLVLVESIGIGPRGHERLQLTATAFERVVATGFSLTPDGITLPPLAPRAIVGGVRFVVLRRVREGRHQELAGLTDELLDWVNSYRSSAVTRLRTLGSGRPPHLLAKRARFLTREDRRSSVMDAMVQLALEQGYTNITDAEIARAAAVSTEAFHREFPNKEECLLAVVNEFAAEAHDAVRRATRNDTEWAEGVYKGVEASDRLLRRASGTGEAVLHRPVRRRQRHGRARQRRARWLHQGDDPRGTGARASTGRRRRGDHGRDLGDPLELRPARSLALSAVLGRSPGIPDPRALCRSTFGRRGNRSSQLPAQATQGLLDLAPRLASILTDGGY